MNKFFLLFFCLSLIACANHYGLNSESYSKEELLLASGVIDYKNDNFTAAKQKFYRVLDLYQSTDNYQGIQLTRVNLVEALLALNQFESAKEQLTLLKRQNKATEISPADPYRLVLLDVKLLFKTQQYRKSLTAIEPLLLHLNNQKINDRKSLELLATAARLEALMNQETEYSWLYKFRNALSGNKEIHPKFRVILKRIDAVIATQNQHYQEALKLLHQALSFYNKQTNRRAMAACLQEIAEIEFKQHNRLQALKYLKSALTIRTRLNDQFHIDKIQQTIIQYQ